MPIPLYDAVVPSFRQILGALPGLLDKAEAFAATNGIDAAALATSRLAPDMQALGYQVSSAVAHSADAIAATRAGVFSPDLSPPPGDFATMRALLADGVAALDALDPAEIDGWVGRDMRFEFRDRRIEFTADQFLLSFSQPNFYFHATAAYAVLRNRGVPLGKMDFLGSLRTRG